MIENQRACDVLLDDATVSQLSALINDEKVIGERYSAGQMKVMDSEKDRADSKPILI
ncbi:hypothetical protein [Veronia nyctiphanis]|uniref:hypothetical protein n=1 Tax=Veronia nyctiphanis TaxID=1278244 RepID=UPI001F40382C|nr:hypothetical protein [Veronia nyctiphanis]